MLERPAFDALNPPPPGRSPDLAPRADTANGDANGPKRAELDAAQAEGQRRVQVCLDALPATAIPGGAARLVVRYVIGNDGHAKEVVVEGGASAEASACGRSAIEGTPFPRFDGPQLANAFSLTYTRPQPRDLATPAPR